MMNVTNIYKIPLYNRDLIVLLGLRYLQYTIHK